MTQPGYSVLIRRGGTPVSITGETTALVSGTTYRVSDAARRVLDPNQPWNVKDGATTLAYSAITSIDFVSGAITLASAPGGAVTFTGKYIPITTASDVLVESRSFTVNDSNALLDTTVFTGTNDRTVRRVAALEDVSISVESIMSRSSTSTANWSYLATTKFRGDPVVVEVFFGDAALPRFRGFCKIESIETSGAVDDLLVTGLEFKIAAVYDPTSGRVASYGYNVEPAV